MDEPRGLTEGDKWAAMTSGNQSYDGLFVYAVKTTGIFCRPSCRARIPLQQNVLFFANAAAARTAGFRPCKKCRPDEAVFAPDRELTSKARELLVQAFNQRVDMDAVARQLGVSKNHLARLYKEQYGLTPGEDITRLRIDQAREMLTGTGLGILPIAYAAGFGSLSNFYACFKAQTGCTPAEYRKRRGEH